MERQRIEIFPGHWIEITPKVRNMVGLRKADRVLAKFNDVTKLIERGVGSRHVKYSQLLKDEAVRLAREVGVKKAVKITGVNKHTILMERRLQAIRAGKKQTRKTGSTYTLEQKQACVRMAMQLIATKEMVERPWRVGRNRKMRLVRKLKWSPKTAFNEAARRLGMNGRAVLFQWSIGAIPMPQPSTQQPSGL